MATLKTKFLDLFRNADSIEIDGAFFRHFDNSVRETDDPAEPVIDLMLPSEEQLMEVTLTGADLDAIEICDEGNVWTVGGCDIEFYTVNLISTNPVE